jgi:hypothetical protein
MATQTSNQPCDTSTLANFVAWATFISTAFQAFGWLQTADTGQIMWTGLNITAVAMSGSNMTCTYSGLTGLALATGRALTVTGWTSGNVGNNGTFVITSLGVGTFTAVNASGVNVGSGGTGVVTKVVATPTSVNAYYEIWQANDAGAVLTPIFIKMEYGTTAGPSIQLLIGTSSNGTGTITGTTMHSNAIYNITNTNYASNGSTTIPCFASGNAGEIRFLLWQGSATLGTIFGIERGKDSNGNIITTTGSPPATAYFSFLSCSTATPVTSLYQSAILGNLAAATDTNWSTFCASAGSASENFNGTTASQPVWPLVGFLGNPMLGFGCCVGADVGEGATVTVSIYGSNHTYLATKTGTAFPTIGRFTTAGSASAILMRYE